MVKDVTNFLFIKDNRVLLGLKKRGFGINKYNGFGGKLEHGETIEEAAIREAKEESGLTPLVYTKRAVIDFPDSYPLRMNLFVATHWSGQEVETDEMLPVWFDFDKVPYHQMWEDDRYWLHYILAGKTIRASFKFENNNDIDGTATNHVVDFLIEEVDRLD